MSTNETVPFVNENGRTPRWFNIAFWSSMVLGLTELVIGAMSSNAALSANAAEMLDNSSYKLDALAANREQDRKTNHRLRRFAGGIIVAAALYTGSVSASNLWHDTKPTNPVDYAALSATGMVLNGLYVNGFHRHAQEGTTHRDAFRHSVADTIGSAMATGAIIASAHFGVPYITEATGSGIAIWTAALTFPTNARIKSADGYYLSQENPLPK